MKKILYIGFLMLFSISWAQVGINTDKPTRDLHVEGNLRVRNLQNKASDDDYSKVLAVDNNGNVDYINKNNLMPDMTEQVNKMVQNNLYTTTDGRPKATETLTCGRFIFNFRGNDAKVSFRLINRPSSTVRVYVTFEQNYVPINNNDGFQYEASSSTRNFSYWDYDFKDIPVTSGQANIADGEYNELYISYPQEKIFYRVTFYRVKQNGETYFINTCEQF
ncbi:hypothetical protein [Empedobacter stercoris]|uniref:hypothetical protein n=1 Tax=Empedobacter stercoris TaxID=1628248 RepID=UPI001CE07552|nr:hypothetical protein [Empedobacter stercoris]MCA4777882.1 hypothetical protein [Empedobacter stercoris]